MMNSSSSILNSKNLSDLDINGWVMLSNISMSHQLRQSMCLKNTTSDLRLANIHNENTKSVKNLIRTDSIEWIKTDTQIPAELNWLNYLEQIMNELKNYFYISLTNIETHYAFFPNGHFYQKHTDQKKENNCRFFSMVCYLNKNWLPTDGGHLISYDGQKIIFDIDPEFGSIILFKSEMEHEVLITHRDRYSVAAWFRTAL